MGTPRPRHQKELDQLLAAYCDGRLDGEGKRRLASLLEEDREARRYYLHYLDLHLDLIRRVSERSSFASGARRKGHLTLAPLPNWVQAVALLVLASIVVALWQGFSARKAHLADSDAGFSGVNSENEAIAYISRADGVVLKGHEASVATGTLLAPQAIDLEKGRLRIDFFNGASLTIAAPALLEIEAVDRVLLRRGSLAARVPENFGDEPGFTVRTPQAVLVDLGTEFAVNVGHDQRSLVHVYRGRVGASLLGKNGTTLRERSAEEGETLEIDPGMSEIRKLDVDSSQFAKAIDPEPIPLRISPAYVAAVKHSRPLGYWRFEKVEKGKVVNEMSASHHAKCMAPISVEGDDDNRAGVFSPRHDRGGLFVKDDFARINQNGEYTLELWVNNSSHYWSGLAALIHLTNDDEDGRSTKAMVRANAEADKSDNPEPRIMALECMPDREKKCWLVHQPRAIRFFHRWPAEDCKRGATNVFSQGPYIPGKWHHIVAVREKRKLSLYHDGKLEQSEEMELHEDDETYHLIIGCYARSHSGGKCSRAFSGRLDEVALYDRALTVGEVETHFHAVSEVR